MMMMRGDDGISGVNKLPPGFLFCPSDEELILHFLYPKATSSLLLPNNNIIPDLDFSLTDPWQLNGKALSSGNNQYYFFTKVNNGECENRSTENGYWKEIGVGEPIVSGIESNKKVGMKKYLVFHIVGEQGGTDHETNWVMQEYHHHHHICSSSAAASSPHQISCSRWVLCRVYEKNSSTRCHHQQGGLTSCSTLFSSDDHEDDDDDDTGTELSWLDEVYLSLDDHMQQEQEQDECIMYN